LISIWGTFGFDVALFNDFSSFVVFSRHSSVDFFFDFFVWNENLPKTLDF
jgi:hypothetical protein